MATNHGEKEQFSEALRSFAEQMAEHMSAADGAWTVKGFIDVYRNIYTISSDTKVISKILEIHLFPHILHFAKANGYSIVLAEKQNWYPDMSFVSIDDPSTKFAVDLKTTYRDPDYPGHVNGFTLGSHGKYFRDRTSTKNIQFPYSDYSGHYCIGIMYTRTDTPIDETAVIELRRLRSIASVIRDFEFFACEKWQLASDRQGSGNTANIGSITAIEDILAARGMFSRLGEDWFDEYWMNYGRARKKSGEVIRNLQDWVELRRGDPSLIVPKRRRRKGNGQT